MSETSQSAGAAAAQAPAAHPPVAQPPRGARKPRPEFRNIGVPDILRYKLPLPGILSILHRLTGALMVVIGIPFLLWMLQRTISSEYGFEQFRANGIGFLGKLLAFVLIWGFCHHLVAGIRYLLLDLHIGVQKEAARQSALVVFVVTAVLTLFGWAKLFGVF